MKISVRVKPSHPGGSYGRAGLRFKAAEPTIVDTEDLSTDQVKALREDPWLNIEPVRSEPSKRGGDDKDKK